MSATLTLIAAVSDDGYISRGSGVPWDLPADKAHFRSYTDNQWLLIGRRTYDEMVGWFKPGHHPLVLTRKRSETGAEPYAAARVHSVTQAVLMARKQPELVCCGGAEVYAAALPHAQKLVITHVHDRLGSGLAFPEISPHDWEPVSQVSHPQDASHHVSFDIITYHRIHQLDLAA